MIVSGTPFAERLRNMLATTLVGLQAHLVRVEVEAVRGPPFFELVGLAEAAVRASRVRVKSALAQVGVDMAQCRIVVNLAPADVKKTGSGFDLAIAAATSAALGAAPCDAIAGVLFAGELSLEGTVQPLRSSWGLASAESSAQSSLLRTRARPRWSRESPFGSSPRSASW